MNRFMKVSTVLGLALVATVATAEAQSANINVTANVFQALAIGNIRPLAFGNVFPGVTKTIAVSDAGNGAFQVTGQASAPVSFTFVLPANLQDASLNNLPINTYTASSAATDVAGAAFDPSTNPTLNLTAGGNLWIRLGATVAPGATQPAGAYTANVVVTVAY